MIFFAVGVKFFMNLALGTITVSLSVFQQSATLSCPEINKELGSPTKQALGKPVR